MGMIIATLGRIFAFRSCRRVGGQRSVVQSMPDGQRSCPPFGFSSTAARRPLRIVHSAPGRMVISGRMADVCAELDRLAALEAAAS